MTAAFGLGGGVALLALMGLSMPVAALVPVHGMVQLGSNAGRAWHLRHHVSTQFAWPFLAGSLAGAVIGAFAVLSLPDSVMKTIMGGFILLTAWVKLPGLERLKGAGIAIGSGIIALISMLVGASGPLLSALLAQMFPGNRTQLVATSAAGMTVHHGLKIIVFGMAGFAFARWFGFIAAMIVSGYLAHSMEAACWGGCRKPCFARFSNGFSPCSHWICCGAACCNKPCPSQTDKARSGQGCRQ